MLNNYLIYKYTSPSGKSYIGQTKDLKQRIEKHKSSSECRAFSLAIKKYGLENFHLSILDENLSIDMANELEEFYINEYRTLHPFGYNLHSGGLNHICSEETKQKLSEAIRGVNHPMFGKKRSEESRKKISNAKKGIKTGRQTEEHRKNISISNKGRKHSEEAKEKMRNHRHSDETKNKLSLTKQGENNPNYGKFGEFNNKSKMYLIVHPNGEEEIIKGLSEFCRQHSINQGLMSMVANGKRNHHKGFKCCHHNTLGKDQNE